MIPGTTSPDEYVLLTAHWDHLGKKDTFLEDDIFNGAVDNATGVAAVLEMAEALAAKPQQRSILFAFVTLEESGLLGSAYMAENPVVDLAQIVAGVNIDGMLPVGRTRDMVVVGYGASELEDMLKDALVPQGRTIKADPLPEAGYFYRSDHISFAKTGVPMLYADGGDDLIEGGIPAGRALAETYTQVNYHKVGDEYKPDWNLSGMVEDIGALLTVVERVANSTDWPNWYEGNEFRATRDAQRAGRGD
jgi:Zn-dependent M28 family amino/carboxypeptidase